MITIKKHTPPSGDYFQPAKSVRELFKGKFEAWYLYEEFIVHKESHIVGLSKKNLIKNTGLSERKWDKAIDDLERMGFLKLETIRTSTGIINKIIHFSSLPIEEWKGAPEQPKDSKFSKEEWKQIHSKKENNLRNQPADIDVQHISANINEYIVDCRATANDEAIDYINSDTNNNLPF